MNHTMSLYLKPLFKENSVLFKRPFESIDEMIEHTAFHIAQQAALPEDSSLATDFARRLFDQDTVGFLAARPALNIRSCFIYRDGDIGHFTIEFLDGAQLRGYPSVEGAIV